jgi:competence protein ComEA
MALNLNTATIQELDALPGIGPVLAERIIEFREKRGGFRRVEELLAVPGISERKWQTLRTLVEVGTRRSGSSSSGARSERNGG